MTLDQCCCCWCCWMFYCDFAETFRPFQPAHNVRNGFCKKQNKTFCRNISPQWGNWNILLRRREMWFMEKRRISRNKRLHVELPCCKKMLFRDSKTLAFMASASEFISASLVLVQASCFPIDIPPMMARFRSLMEEHWTQVKKDTIELLHTVNC